MSEKWYFISDTHLGHKRINELDQRPFKDVEEHDRVLIGRWNETVAPDDNVWVVGDFSMGPKPASYYLEQLHGHIHLIRGNHDDKRAWREKHLFASAHEALYWRHKGIKIYLCHYPCYVWRSSHRGTWQIHGHCHNDLPQPTGKIMDVCCKGNDYRPYSFEQVEAFMANRPNTDHHDMKLPEFKLPGFAKVGDVVLRYMSGNYHRDAGCWSVNFGFNDNRELVVSTAIPNLRHINGRRLLPATEAEWRESNHGYV